MLVRSSELMALEVKTADGARHHISDLCTEAGGIALERVVVDFVGWVERVRVALSVRRFAEPDLAAGTWVVDLDERDLLAREGVHGLYQGRSLKDRLGALVVGSDGSTGELVDLVYSTADWHPDHLIVRLGDPGAAPVVVALGDLRHADWRTGAVEIGLGLADLSRWRLDSRSR